MGWTHALTRLLAWAILLCMVAYVVWPTLADLRLHGIHDWDTQEEFRYLVFKTIRRYHQFPFWNPYTCGGHPVWAGVESDSVLVSPFLPAYLFLPLAVALRVELVGSALISTIGSYLFAGRFTRSPAVRALVAAVFAINGRWTLQITSGHLWHYAWEWTPLALYFFDRACEAALVGRWSKRDFFGAGASLAMMVYTGGIYPLPQTVVLLVVYVAIFAATLRDARPVICLALTGAVAFVLSAPKLLPTLELFGRYPRLTDSTEWLDFSTLWAILTSRDQDFGSRPAPTSQWGWHEWGMYIGVVPVGLIVMAAFVGRGQRLSALRWTAILATALGFGSFHPFAPWSVLHEISIFRSQHVPSRWLYPALLLSLAIVACVLELFMVRARQWRPLVELAAIAITATVARDVAQVARLPLVHAFGKPPPSAHESTGPFHTEVHLPAELGFSVEWVPPALPTAVANVGTTDCGTFFPFFFRDHNGHAAGLGAKGKGEAAYRGEVFVVEGEGQAEITRWSPNEVEVRVTGARPGEHLALNQNFDPGWTANGRSAVNVKDVTAAILDAPAQTVVFRYFAPRFGLGIFVFVGGVSAAGWFGWHTRRRRAHALAERPGPGVGLRKKEPA